MKILFLSRWYPWPADNGARLRVLNLIKALARRHEVLLVSFADGPVAPEALAAMRQWCASVATVTYRGFRPGGARALLGFFDRRPRSVVDTYNVALRDAAVRVGRVDLALASEIDMVPYALAADARRRVLEELEVGAIAGATAHANGARAKLRTGLTWWKLARYVRGTLKRFDACTVVSAAERDLAVGLAPAGYPIEVLPNGVDIAAMRAVTATPTPDTLIYAGALTYHANYDAVAYFLEAIHPLIRERCPEVRLTVTGRTDGVDLGRLLPHPGVRFSGYLDDVRPTVAGAWLSVVPLRVGGGTRLKILESLALGTPVVATRKGAEGLDLVDGRDVLLADTPAAFAEAAVRVLRDPALRARLADAGRIAASRYDWGMIGDRLLTLIDRFDDPGGA